MTGRKRRQKHSRRTPSFVRSTNLERDGAAVLKGYVPTSRALDLVERVVDALEHGHGIALSVVGPYGSGKSSAVLFLRALLGAADADARGVCRRKLLAISPDLLGRLERVLRLLDCEGSISAAVAVATREPIAATVARAIKTVPGYEANRGTSQAALDRLMNDTLTRPLILIIDEFGKTLEHFAERPASSDLFILQQLAERAVAIGAAPLILITLQHLAIEEYLSLSTPQAQREWAKVQGRFADFAFAESSRQVRKLIGAALRAAPTHTDYPDAIVAAHARQIRILLHDESLADLDGIRSTWPLHPISVVALPELCAKYAQNERTLFSFLRSDDPAALPQFRPTRTSSARTLLGLDAVFDYFVESARSQLMAARGARRWLEVESRLSDARGRVSARQLAISKTVGVLNLITAGGAIRASRAMVEYASLDDPGDERIRQEIHDALESLVASGLLTYRAFSDEYRIWAGSDFDLSAAFERAHFDVSHNSVAGVLQDARPRAPIVASRLSSRTGALRAFACQYVDENTQLANEPEKAADGLVLLWVGASRPQADLKMGSGRPFLLVHARDAEPLRRTALEVVAYRHILKHSTQLATDWVARREVVERMSLAEQRLDHAVWDAFDAADARPAMTWVNGTNDSAAHRTLSAAVSDIAEQAYSRSPYIANEVINRQELTSQGAAARRTLMEAMIKQQMVERLGLEGFGPEVTIYEAVLKSTGIHRRDSDGSWTFAPPSRRSPVRELWTHFESELERCMFRKLNIAELFTGLSGPPFGVRLGPLPILVAAFLLVHDDEAAVYEHGTYQPELSPELLERLAKNPSNFDVRSFALKRGVRRSVIDKALREFKLPSAPRGRNSTLLAVVRPILNTFRNLPEYARQTRSISPETAAVRQVLLEAREPDDLLFESLPRAVGFGPFGVDDSSGTDPAEYIGRLKASLRELQQAFPTLLTELASTLAHLLRVDVAHVRQVLRERAAPLIDWASGGLASFLIAGADPMNSDEDWLQRVASGLVGKAPKVWRDDDKTTFHNRVRESVGAMQRLEFLRAADHPDIAKSAYRLCLTLPDGSEHVVLGPAAASPAAVVEVAERAVKDALASAGPQGPAAVLRHMIEMLAGAHGGGAIRTGGNL